MFCDVPYLCMLNRNNRDIPRSWQWLPLSLKGWHHSWRKWEESSSTMFPWARSKLETVFSCISSHPIFTMVIVLLFWQDLTGCWSSCTGGGMWFSSSTVFGTHSIGVHCSDTGVYFYFTCIFRVYRTVTFLFLTLCCQGVDGMVTVFVMWRS